MRRTLATKPRSASWRSPASRNPLAESALATRHITKVGDAKRAYEDIVWALINTNEFLFNYLFTIVMLNSIGCGSWRASMPTLISESLRIAIRACELSDAEIGRRSGIAQSQVTRFRTGKGGLNLASAEKLAVLFGMELAEASDDRLERIESLLLQVVSVDRPRIRSLGSE